MDVQDVSKRDVSFLSDTILNETTAHALASRGYSVVKLPTETSFLYCSFYSLCHQFFTASAKFKQSFSQIQFDDNKQSPNSLHGYSLVEKTKEQFMLRYVNSTSHATLTDIKTPSTVHDDEKAASNANDTDFGVLGLLLYEKLDALCRNIMKDVLHLYNKPESIAEDLLDPVHVENGSITRNLHHCSGEYTLNGYISSSVLDCYHYFPQTQGKYGHAGHYDSGLLTLIPITSNNASLQVFDRKEDAWIDIEQLVYEYCDGDEAGKRNKAEYAVVMLGESVNPYLNKHISSSENQLKPCFYRVDNGEKERFSVVYKQRTAPLRSHARYQDDFFLAKLHSEIDVDSVHARLMKGKDKSRDYINYQFYEYSAYDKSKIALMVGGAMLFGLYLLKKQGILDVQVKVHWK